LFLRHAPSSILGVAPTPRIPPELTKGPFSVDEARRHGVSGAQLLGASWRRLGRGFYAWHEIAEAPMTRLIAAKLRLPDAAVFTGPTAAWLHSLDIAPCSPIEAAVPSTSSTSRLVGMVVRRCTIPAAETSIRRGLRVTSAVRTIADLACRLQLTDAVALLDSALHRRLVSTDGLRDWGCTHAGYRGVRRLRRALELADPAAESVMETRLRVLLVLAGLPRPRAQVSLRDDLGLFVARPDLFYPGARLAIEYDGATHRESLAADNRRQNRLIDAGYRLLRFTAGDVLDAPAAVVSMVRRALASPISASPSVRSVSYRYASIPRTPHTRR
jgi:very-short-patch-repair endonuclease